jgi:hypothetical protein
MLNLTGGRLNSIQATCAFHAWNLLVTTLLCCRREIDERERERERERIECRDFCSYVGRCRKVNWHWHWHCTYGGVMVFDHVCGCVVHGIAVKWTWLDMAVEEDS